MVLREGGKLLSIDVVVLIGTLFISVAGTFFATRASLEGRIEKLEAKLPVADYVTTRAITHNVNQLSFLRTQIIELEAEVNRIEIPNLQFAKGLPPELSGYIATPWQLNQEWVANLSETPPRIRPLEIDKISKLLDGDAASALRSDDAFLRLQSFVQLAQEYNRALAELVDIFGTPATQVYVGYPTLRRGVSRSSAEVFKTVANELVLRMKQSMSGLRPPIDDEIQVGRALLDKGKGG